MSVPRSARLVLLAFAAGCAPLTLALALPGQPTPPTSSSKTGADSPRAVAEALDAIVQPRFLDDQAGVFGTGRLVSPVRGHVEAAASEMKSPSETRLWEAVNRARLSYVMGFYHCAHLPGRFTDQQPPPNLLSKGFGTSFSGPDPFHPAIYSFSRLFTVYPASDTPASPAVWQQRDMQEKAQNASLQTAALKALPALMKGKGQETTQGDLLVVMRPVLAAKDSCLGCHIGAKKNDTLGIMVYAVRNTSANTVSKP